MWTLARRSARREGLVRFVAAVALLGAVACADIEVAVNGGGGDAAGGDSGGGGGADGVDRPDGAGPRDSGGRSDTARVDTPGGEDVPQGRDVAGRDVPVGRDAPADVPPDRDVPDDRDVPSPFDAGDGAAPLPCVDELLDPAWGTALAAPLTLTEEDDFAGSCGGAESKDVAYGWVVPFTDWFVIDTSGSDFDTSLYVLEGCEGPEVECHNDLSAADFTSRIVRRFREGERRVIVFDGVSGSSGNGVLNIQPVRCPSADVGGGATLPQQYSTAAGPAEHGGDCGGDTGPERSFRFTPPADGLWRISARALAGETLETALYLERGPICGGPLLQCNGHDSAHAGLPTEVTRLLPGGLPVTIIVDSRSGGGNFELDIQRVGDSCPAVPFDELFDVDIDINAQSDIMTTSCGENANVQFNSFEPYPDLLVTLDDLEPDSGASCQLDVSAGFPVSAALLRGECSGAEVACGRADDMSADTRFRVTHRLPRLGGRLTLVVSPVRAEMFGWVDSKVRVAMFCVAAAP